MNNLLESILFFLEDKHLVEMANLYQEETGIDHSVLNVVTRGGTKHAPRVKVSNIPGKFAHNDNFSVTVENEPRIVGNCKLKQKHLDDVIDWVKLNKEHLHKIWYYGDSMKTKEFYENLKKI